MFLPLSFHFTGSPTLRLALFGTVNIDVTVFRWRISSAFLEGPLQALDTYSITAVVNDTIVDEQH